MNSEEQRVWQEFCMTRLGDTWTFFVVDPEHTDVMIAKDCGGFIMTRAQAKGIWAALNKGFALMSDQDIERHNAELLDQYEHHEFTPCTPSSKKAYPGEVYIMEAIEKGGLYKIGHSRDAKQRAKSFATMPLDIRLLCSFKTKDMIGLERTLHKHFASKRDNGEWFWLSSQDLLEAQEIAGAYEH